MRSFITKNEGYGDELAYESLLNEVEFSFSTLHQYEQCPYAFYLKKIDGTEINEGNFYSDAGGYMHEVLEIIFSGKLPVDDAIPYYIENYSNSVVYETKQSTMEKKYNQAVDFLAAFDMTQLDNYEILGVEKEVHFELDGYKFIGFIDLLLRNKQTEKIIIVDHKSSDHFLKKDGSPLKNQQANFEAYSKQMYLYSKAVFDEYGEYPDRIVWNHFFDQQVTNIPFKYEDYCATQQWALNIIRRIYTDENFDAVQNYMMCKVLCGYRNSCCYATEESENN